MTDDDFIDLQQGHKSAAQRQALHLGQGADFC